MLAGGEEKDVAASKEGGGREEDDTSMEDDEVDEGGLTAAHAIWFHCFFFLGAIPSSCIASSPYGKQCSMAGTHKVSDPVKQCFLHTYMVSRLGTILSKTFRTNYSDQQKFKTYS